MCTDTQTDMRAERLGWEQAGKTGCKEDRKWTDTQEDRQSDGLKGCVGNRQAETKTENGQTDAEEQTVRGTDGQKSCVGDRQAEKKKENGHTDAEGQTVIETDGQKGCVWDDLNYQDAMNSKIRTVNTCQHSIRWCAYGNRYVFCKSTVLTDGRFGLLK